MKRVALLRELRVKGFESLHYFDYNQLLQSGRLAWYIAGCACQASVSKRIINYYDNVLSPCRQSISQNNNNIFYLSQFPIKVGALVKQLVS